MPVREKFVRSGDWRTLETFWNVTTTAWFQKPAGAEVKIRYSGWWFGADRQRQRLDGSTVKRLVISRWSVFTARLQIRVTNDTAVIYVVEAGDVANLPPGILLIRPVGLRGDGCRETGGILLFLLFLLRHAHICASLAPCRRAITSRSPKPPAVLRRQHLRYRQQPLQRDRTGS